MSTTYGLHRAVLLNRNGTALVFEDRRRTFAELADRVARLAGALKALGVGQGRPRRGPELEPGPLYRALSRRRLGRARSSCRSTSAGARPKTRTRLRDCRPKILVVDAAFAAMGAELAERSARFRLIYADDAPPRARKALPDYETICSRRRARRGRRSGRHGACRHLLHRRHHRALQRRDAQPPQSDGQCAERARRRPGATRTPSISTPRRCSISPTPPRCTSTSLVGGSHAIMRMFTPEGLAQAIETLQRHDVLLVPTMIQMFVDHLPDLASYDLSSLRTSSTALRRSARRCLDRAIASCRTSSSSRATA